jgi:hypothetical protein
MRKIAGALLCLLAHGAWGGQHWIGAGPRVAEWTEASPADRVRLGVRDEGVYRVTADEIARASGVGVDAARQALQTGALALSCRGEPTAWAHDGEALYFHGRATDELFAPENVYWLSAGQGVTNAPPSAPAGAWSMHTEHYRTAFLAPYEPRDRRSGAGTLTNVLNFGEWVPASGDEAARRQSRTLELKGFDGTAATGVTVRVELASYRDFVTPDDHLCEILVNGVGCGAQGWSGERAVAFEYPVPAGAATGGTVSLTVKNAGTPGRVAADFMILDVALTYPRANATLETFGPSVSGTRDVDWSAPDAMPELAIVVPPRRWWPGFAEAARPLAAFREAQGLRTRVVDAEEIYNAFSDGLAHPEAFRRFSAAGVTNGAGQTLRYLLFAGQAGTDYKLDAFPPGSGWAYPTLFPLYLLPQVETSKSAALLLPNDPVLGDVAGGAAPEVAVGRFLAADAAELARMVDKTIRYELTETWKRKAVFSADWQNTGSMYANFTGIAATAAAAFPGAGWWVEPFYPAANQSNLGPFWRDTYYQTGVYYELLEGAGFFYFVGHSGDKLAGYTENNKLFDASMLQAASWPFAPVALLMGCRMGRWTTLDLRTGEKSIAEAGTRNPFSGFAAVVSAAGYMTVPEAATFSAAFRNQVASGAPRLGDIWLGAFAELGGEAALALRHMVLLGDPALGLRADRTARGTPTDWLLEHGLTGDPYADLDDQDGDGFVTWVEAQAGTDPLSGALRLKGVSLQAGGQGLALAFEALAGHGHRVLSTTDLAGGVWQPVPWRPESGGAWTDAPVEGDWPLKRVEVPFADGAARRFYKVVTEE